MIKLKMSHKYISYVILFFACFHLVPAFSYYESPEKDKPELILERFYGFVFFKNQSPDVQDLAQVKNYFEEKFYNDLIILMKISGKKEILEYQLEFAPFIGAQDMAQGFMLHKPLNKVQNQKAGSFKEDKFQENSLYIPVSFLLHDETSKSTSCLVAAWKGQVLLIKTGSGWKIQDFIYKNNISLNRLAKQAAEYVRKNNIKEDSRGFYSW